MIKVIAVQANGDYTLSLKFRPETLYIDGVVVSEPGQERDRRLVSEE